MLMMKFCFTDVLLNVWSMFGDPQMRENCDWTCAPRAHNILDWRLDFCLIHSSHVCVKEGLHLHLK